MKAICIGGPADGQIIDYDGAWFNFEERLIVPMSLHDIQSTRDGYEKSKYTTYRADQFIYNNTSYWMWIPIAVKSADVEAYVFDHLFNYFTETKGAYYE